MLKNRARNITALQRKLDFINPQLGIQTATRSRKGGQYETAVLCFETLTSAFVALLSSCSRQLDRSLALPRYEKNRFFCGWRTRKLSRIQSR